MPPSAKSRFLERRLTLRMAGESLLVTYAPDGSPERMNGTAGGCHGSAAHGVVSQLSSIPQATATRIGELTSAVAELQGKNLAHLGDLLAQLALPEPVRGRFVGDLAAAAQSDGRVRLAIDASEPPVAQWPWEFLRVAEVGEPRFLALHPCCSIVRSSHRPVNGLRELPAAPLGPLEVLIVWADPRSSAEPDVRMALPPLYAADQMHDIKRCFEERIPGVAVRLLVPAWFNTHRPPWHTGPELPTATRMELARALRNNPADIVFFVGHGRFDEAKNEGVLFLESDPGDPQRGVIGATELGELFPPSSRTRLILVDPCESGSRGPDGRGQSVAEALAWPGRAVVTMQFQWPSATSAIFWNAFLASMPASVDVALSRARELIYRFSINHDDYGDWAFPVLHRCPAETPLGLKERSEPEIASWQELVGRLSRCLSPVLRATLAGLLRKVLAAIEANENEVGIRRVLTSDTLFTMLAGDAKTPSETSLPSIETSPLWYTTLLAAPDRLSWSEVNGQESWYVALVGPRGVRFIATETDAPTAPLSETDRRSLPRGTELRWEVRCSPVDSPRVRGFFRILPASEVSAIELAVGEVTTLPSGIARDLALADIYLTAGLYDDLVHFLSERSAAYPSGPEGFAIRRCLAEVYREVQRELTERLAGYPEGAWADELAKRHGNAAYQAGQASQS